MLEVLSNENKTKGDTKTEKQLLKSTSSSESGDEEYEDIVDSIQEKNGKVSKLDFSMVSIIGVGSYGKVYLVKKLDNGKLYAMKVLKKSFIRKQRQVKNTW